MILPNPVGSKIDAGFLSRVFDILKRADDSNLKRDRDVEIGVNRIILTSPDGTRYAVVVSNLGVLTATAV